NIPSDISIDTIKAKMDSMGESVVKQYAINRVKEEYKAVGLDIEKVQMKYIAKTGLKMLGITLVSALITICNSYLISRLSSAFAKELRSKVVKKVMSFSNEEFESLSASSLITRTTNDIQQIQMLIVMLMRVVVYAPIIGIGAFLKVKDSSMAWVIGVALVAILAVILVLFFVAVPNFKKVQELLDRVNLVSREILTGLPVIRAFATEKYEEKRFDKANKDLTKVNLFVNKVMSVMMPTMMFIMNAICILIIWVGADRIDNATILIGDLMELIQY
uniref:ABC transporter permease n=1 Tax=Methanobrevibacter smithii TaxID=2173 RepID=UPI003FED6C68